MSSNWKHDANDPAGRIQVGKFNKALGRLNWEASTYEELSGVVGGVERRVTYTAIMGAHRDDVSKFKTELGEKYLWTVSRSNVNEIIAAIDAGLVELAKTRPVKDTRKTVEQVAEDTREMQEAAAKREADGKAQAEAWALLYGGAGSVTVPEGQKAVTLTLCYDNSDMQSDYFDRHATLSPEYAVMLTGARAETEALARAALACLPADVQALGWEWHTEKYANGHGNYLESSGFELSPEVRAIPGLRTAYRGTPVERGHWEIRFAGSWRKELPKHRCYGTAPERGASVSGSVTGVTVTENTEKAGVEIRFPAKPDEATLTALKANGWRWSRFAHCWYHRADAHARAFAHGLAGTTTDTTNADDHSGQEDRECGDRAYEDRCAAAVGM